MNIIAFKQAPRTLEESIEAAVATVQELIGKQHSLVMTCSSGKDSTTTTLLCLEAIRRSAAAGVRQATHYVSSSSTTVENPEIDDNLLAMHADIEAWVHAQGLPVEVHMVQPALAARFVTSTIGRGTLPRFVENGSVHRSCSSSWKVLPQQRLAKELASLSQAAGHRETISVLGTRLDESQVRGAAMLRRHESACVPTRNADGHLTLSLIADWSESMVWEFLALFLDEDTAPFPAFTDEGAIRRMLTLYRDANSGTCGMLIGDGQKAPCGSRFGCWTCTITGDKDKSMESLLDSDPRYDYMRGLNDFRNFLINTQWDLSRRELIGRSLSKTAHVPVRPDVYNLRMRRELLGYLLTIDALEVERAERLDADIAAGRVEATPLNQRMRHPQFEHVSYAEIALIDFYWSMHPYAASAFPALSIWYEVKHLGRRWKIPLLAKAPVVPIPAKRWFHVGAFDAQAPADGLRDYSAEQWNRYLHPERPLVNRVVDGERVTWFEEKSSLEVDSSAAWEVVERYCTTSLALDSQHHHAMESARFWLNEEVVKLPVGMAARYQAMAVRGQYFANLADRLQLTPDEMNAHLMRESITEAEHQALLAEIEAVPMPQYELFAA